MNYYLTHDCAGHQLFLLKTDDAIDDIEEKIEDGAIAYSPSSNTYSFRIGGEWVGKSED